MCGAGLVWFGWGVFGGLILLIEALQTVEGSKIRAVFMKKALKSCDPNESWVGTNVSLTQRQNRGSNFHKCDFQT